MMKYLMGAWFFDDTFQDQVHSSSVHFVVNNCLMLFMCGNCSERLNWGKEKVIHVPRSARPLNVNTELNVCLR